MLPGGSIPAIGRFANKRRELSVASEKLVAVECFL
jgi:hypothetical protein